LDFGSGFGVLQHQGDMLGLDVPHAHISGELLARNDYGDFLRETQELEELRRPGEITDDDGCMIEMLYHSLFLQCTAGEAKLS
jgi:hypothetical protein